nr:hypothetical protein CFP56_07708 [Quercus suber]
MAKDKKSGPGNKHLHARIAYLHEAASYLATQNSACPIDCGRNVSVPPGQSLQPQATACVRDVNHIKHSLSKSKPEESAETPCSRSREHGLPNLLPYHLRQVAQKAIIRLSPEIKRSVCKTCSGILVEGKTSRQYVENLSRLGAKAHADVLVLECFLCGTKKRIPVGAERPLKRKRRVGFPGAETDGTEHRELVEKS